MTRKHTPLLALWLALVSIATWAFAPIDMPQIKLSDLPKIHETKRDSLEEDIYYILIEQSENALKNNDFETAALRMVEAMAHEPNNPNNIPLLSNLGIMYSMLNKDSLALQAFDRALDRAPKMSTVLTNRGKLHLKMANDSAAYCDFNRVLQLDSLNTTALYYHGMMSLYAGDIETCQRDFSALEKISPKSTDTYAAMATLYSLTGRDLEAISYFRKLIERDPAAEYFSGLAGCQLALSNLGDASETIAEGLRKYPGDPELLYYRAWLNRDRYRLDDAHRDATEAIRAGANPARVNALFK